MVGKGTAGAASAGSLQAFGLGLPLVGDQMAFVLLEALGLFRVLRTAVRRFGRFCVSRPPTGTATRAGGAPVLISPSFSSFYLSART